MTRKEEVRGNIEFAITFDTKIRSMEYACAAYILALALYLSRNSTKESTYDKTAKNKTKHKTPDRS